MSLHLAHPLALLLLGLLPLLLFGLRRPGGRAAVALRAVALAGVVLLLAGAYGERSRPAGGACVIVAVDVSASVADAGQSLARQALNDLAPLLGPRDLVGVIAFADGARVVAAPAPAPPPPSVLADAFAAAGLDPGESDLAAAVGLASSLCPDDRQAALLLASDGRETRGNVLAAAAFTDPPLPVFPLAPGPGTLPPAVIRRLLAPARAPDRLTVPLEAVVESGEPAPVEAGLVVTADEHQPHELPLTMVPGLSVVALPYRARGVGMHTVDAALRVPAPGPLLPGHVRTALEVTPAPHVLVTSDRPGSLVAGALQERGLEVESLRPAELMARVGQLGARDVVVLDDLARGAMPAPALAALASWVAGGGALVVTGGPHLFGDPGLADSPLARVLPVELLSQAPEPKEREPIALYLVIDRSNSMGWTSRPEATEGEKMEYARRAALAVLDQLGPNDLVGGIAFDSRPYELGPLRPVDQGRTELAARIRELRPGGGTDFKEALEIASRNLVGSKQRVRHIILLTDGDTNRRADDHDTLIAELARNDVSVTSIRIGADTGNLELLEHISSETGGEFHHVADVPALPQLMIRDTRRLIDAPGSMVNAAVRIGDPGPLLAGIDEEELPRVGRWATTRLRPEAELRLWLDAGSRHDPLLATWQYELGRVAVLPVDFRSGAAEWAGWDGFGKLWAQVVLWTLPDGGVAAAAQTTTVPEHRAVGVDAALLRQLASTTGGRLSPEPAMLLAAREGVAPETLPLESILVPLVLLALLGDVALRRLAR